MTKTITMALVATLGLGLAFGACAAEKTLAEKTKNLEPNPHKSHLGAVNCVECHKADKPSKQPELMCNSCHNFTLKTK